MRTATTGIGHTRWATHGRVNESNAHPHFDTSGAVHVVVNGIVENYVALKRRLQDMGAVFTSETDAEVIAHLVAHHCALGSLEQAVIAAFNELEGHFAFVAMRLDETDTLVGVRKECPLVVGRGEGETFLASAIPAFLSRDAPHPVHRERRDRRDHARRRPLPRRRDGSEHERRSRRSTGTRRPPRRAASTRSCSRRSTSRPTRSPTPSRTAPRRARTSTSTTSARWTRTCCAAIDRILITGCGTAYHAGLMGRYALEEWAQIRTDIDVASEYRYRKQLVGPGDLVIGMTQSGETADTLAAMRAAREAGATVLAVTNVVGSQATRDADGVLYTRAGMEIGVAATKTFVCQVAVMYLLALKLAELRGTMKPATMERIVGEIKRLPHAIQEVVAAATDPETRPAGGPRRRGRRAPLAGRLLPVPRAATSASRSRWRARSSSRRSPTSRPTPTPRAR